MKLGRIDIVEDFVATSLMAAAVLAFTATHDNWGVWLIGDSRRWTAGLLVLLGTFLFGVVGCGHTAQHLRPLVLGVLACVAACFAGFAFATASLTPLSLLAATIVVVWALALASDLRELPRGRLLTH
ncbi:MAG TPA: hypothetical protein VFW80_06705 [Gaiellaceae bacterium]|nr:hypothetical protein [Gaiellaceae bacterium]